MYTVYIYFLKCTYFLVLICTHIFAVYIYLCTLVYTLYTRPIKTNSSFNFLIRKTDKFKVFFKYNLTENNEIIRNIFVGSLQKTDSWKTISTKLLFSKFEFQV